MQWDWSTRSLKLATSQMLHLTTVFFSPPLVYQTLLMFSCPSWIWNSKIPWLTRTEMTVKGLWNIVREGWYWCNFLVCEWICLWHTYSYQLVFLCGYCSVLLYENIFSHWKSDRTWMRWYWFETRWMCLIFTSNVMCQDICSPADELNCVDSIFVCDLSDIGRSSQRTPAQTHLLRQYWRRTLMGMGSHIRSPQGTRRGTLSSTTKKVWHAFLMTSFFYHFMLFNKVLTLFSLLHISLHIHSNRLEMFWFCH